MLAKRTLNRDERRVGSAAAAAEKPTGSSLVHFTPVKAPVTTGRTEVSTPTPASPGLLAVGRKLVAETDRLVERLVQMVRGIPEYSQMRDEAMWNEVRQILRANIPVFVNAVVEARIPRDEEVAAARFFARRRVHQGIPLRGHLTAYRNGMWMLWEELVDGVMHRPALQKELLRRAAWAFQHLDIVSSAVSEAYYAEQEGRARHRDRVMRELFDEIIDGGPSTPEELQGRAAALDLRLESDFHILNFLLPPGGSGPSRVADIPSVAVVVAEALALPLESVVSVERSRELVVLAPSNGEELRVAVLRSRLAEALEPTARAGVPVLVGVSGLVSRISGVRQGYKEARRAAEIGQMLDPTGIVYFYENYILHDVLDSGSAPGKRLVAEALGPLLSAGETGQRLIDTLCAYFSAGSNLKVAAAALDIHPNTLAYRMRQIHQLTGLDAGNPEQRLRAEIALQLFSLDQKREQIQRPEGAERRATMTAAKSRGKGGVSRHDAAEDTQRR